MIKFRNGKNWNIFQVLIWADAEWKTLSPHCFYVHKHSKKIQSILPFTDNGTILFQAVNGLFGHGSCCGALKGNSCDYLDHSHLTEYYQAFFSLWVPCQQETFTEPVPSNTQVKGVTVFTKFVYSVLNIAVVYTYVFKRPCVLSESMVSVSQ